MPENSSVIAYDIMENETMARLIHNHTFMELDEYEGTGDTSEKLTGSSFQNSSELLSSNHSVELISERVKERVEKTQLLKEKLQRIIRRTCLSRENSTVTKVASKMSLAGGEHPTSLGLDHMFDGTKIVLPEQEFPADLDFSINVLVIGKTGVGKSATVNSIFGETKSAVGAFGVTTNSANYVVGNVGGIQISILDTPGLLSSATEEQFNQEVLMSIKKSMRKFPNTDVEKAGVFGSQLSSFTLFCSLWNVLLNSGHTSHSHDDLEEKKRKLLDSYPEIIWDEQSQECLEQETLLVENQESEDVERQHEKGTVLGRVRTRRGRLGFQATKRFGIYLDTSDVHAGFSIGSRDCRRNVQEEGKILVRMRGSMSVLGLDGHDSEDTKQSTADMTAFVQNLLQQMILNLEKLIYFVVAKIRLLISESISNSSSAVDKEHSAMVPLHFDSIGTKSPEDWEVTAANKKWTVRIAMIIATGFVESPLIVSFFFFL
ncbi:OEP8 like protein [Arabidopsis thaliana]|nr:OEP8 like protein [Arabidopsis thaliana]CAB78622.1 OEP8 like protein [Arabidopsis thaliana]